MNEMTITVIEQPGTIGFRKARMISKLILDYYRNAPPELRAEIDRKVEELRKQKEAESA